MNDHDVTPRNTSSNACRLLTLRPAVVHQRMPNGKGFRETTEKTVDNGKHSPRFGCRAVGRAVDLPSVVTPGVAISALGFPIENIEYR